MSYHPPVGLNVKQLLARNSLVGLFLAFGLGSCGATQSSALTQTSTPQATQSPASAPQSSPVASPQPATSERDGPSPAYKGDRNAPDHSDQQTAAQVIRDYYTAISNHDYEQAYRYWGSDGAASSQSFAQFKQGFVKTASVQVTLGEPGALEGAVGSLYITIPVTITATTVDGTTQKFQGNYTLRRVNDVPGSTVEQRMCHLYSAQINQVS